MSSIGSLPASYEGLWISFFVSVFNMCTSVQDMKNKISIKNVLFASILISKRDLCCIRGTNIGYRQYRLTGLLWKKHAKKWMAEETCWQKIKIVKSTCEYFMMSTPYDVSILVSILWVYLNTVILEDLFLSINNEKGVFA